MRSGFLLAAAVVMGVGLIKSYSRGAWVGAAVGLGVLTVGSLKSRVQNRWNAECGVRNAEYGSANDAPARSTLNARPFNRGVWLAVIVLSLGVLAFWSFRDTKWRPARRAASVGNVNDFSWRNRVAAWEGALQMMADKPWFGFGWNQPERVYDSFYRPARLTEGAAIQMNDYLMLGSTLGVPALMCFVMYVRLCLTRRPSSVLPEPPSPADHRPLTTDHGPPTTDYRSPITDYSLKTVCRAGAVVLLVGFWFDGGLFKLATAATFWILLELGRTE